MALMDTKKHEHIYVIVQVLFNINKVLPTELEITIISFNAIDVH